MPITDNDAVQRLVSMLTSLQGARNVYGPTGSGPDWHDQMPGSTDHLIATGSAVHDGVKAIFDGSGHFETADVPESADGFAGHASDYDSFNGSGFTIVLLAKFEPGTLAGTVLKQWENTGDNTCSIFRFNANGQLQVWTRSASQGGSYLTNPPSDRFVTYAPDLRPILEDGLPHLIVLSRGTTHPPEAKFIMIDQDVKEDDGSGNGIDLFSDFDVPLTIGLAAPTTIIGDASFTNLEAHVWVLAIRNRYTTPQEADSMWRALVPRRAKPKHAATMWPN